MLPGALFSLLYTSQTPQSRRLTTFRIPTRLSSLLVRLTNPLVDPQGSAAPRRADRVLPGEISESAMHAQARMQTLTRQVRAAQEVQQEVRRQVEQGAVERRRNVGRALEALQDRLAAAQGTPVAGSATGDTGTARPADAVPPSPRPRSRFGLGGWVDRAGEAVGLRTESPAVLPGGTDTPLTGQAAVQPRAPTQQEVDAIVGMFPNLSRDAVVRALQTRLVALVSWVDLRDADACAISNYNTALAVELLLAEST